MKRENDLRGQAAVSSTAGAESLSLAKKLRALVGSDEEGQALIETALSITVLMMVVTGIFAFGIVFYQEMQLQQAVYAGARTLALNQGVSVADPCAAATTAVQNAAPAFDHSKLNISFYEKGVSVSGSTCSGKLNSSDSVTVTATYPCSYPIVGVTLGSCQLYATSTQPAE